jgi:phosphatidylglycerophosphate synthase
MKAIPYILTYSRLVMAVFYILVSICKPLQSNALVVGVLIAAILTDIFDGVIARRLKMSTVHLRQLDSKVDTVFWLSLMYVLIIMQSSFVKAHAIGIFILVASEILIQVIGYFRFNSSLALHTYAAKAWAILLTITVCEVFIGSHANFWFNIAFVWGIIAQLEIIIIIFKLKTFKADVSSVFTLLKPQHTKVILKTTAFLLGFLMLQSCIHSSLHIKEKLVPLTDQNMTSGFIDILM